MPVPLPRPVQSPLPSIMMVILGAHYLRHLTITATGSIVPSESGATALYDPTSNASARVQNTGLITGGAGAITVGGAVVDLAGKGSILTNSGTVDGGGAGVVLEAGASLTNSGAIVGGRGM